MPTYHVTASVTVEVTAADRETARRSVESLITEHLPTPAAVAVTLMTPVGDGVASTPPRA